MTPLTIAERFAELEKHLATERGPFVLFALVLRPELSTVVSTSGDSGVLGRWDLIVSADWLSANRTNDLEYVTSQLKALMGSSTLGLLSRIVVLAPTDAFVKAVTTAFSTEHNPVEVRSSNLFGIFVEHAFIITARSTPREVAHR